MVKTRGTRLRMIALLGLLSSVGAWAQNDPLIWLLLDVPPSIILDGPYRGEGNLDKVRQLLMERLPGYDHQTEVGNIERITRELQGTRPVVSPGLLLTADRQRQFAVSIPEAIIPANMLIVRRDRLTDFQRFLDANGEIDLAALLASPLRVGVAQARRYSGPVDELLAQAAEKPTLIARSASNVSEGLVMMLINQRLDCCLLFPFEAQFIARQLGQAEALVSLPIRGMPPYSVVVAAAPRTAWGEALIAQLNPLIRQYRQTAFVDALAAWLDDKASRRYRQQAAEFFAANP